MPASVGYLVIDTTDPQQLAPFWCGLLGASADAAWPTRTVTSSTSTPCPRPDAPSKPRNDGAPKQESGAGPAHTAAVAQAALPGRWRAWLPAVRRRARTAAWSRISGIAVVSYQSPRSGGPSVKMVLLGLPAVSITAPVGSASMPSRSGSGRASPRPRRSRSSGSAAREMSVAGPVPLISQPAVSSALMPFCSMRSERPRAFRRIATASERGLPRPALRHRRHRRHRLRGGRMDCPDQGRGAARAGAATSLPVLASPVLASPVLASIGLASIGLASRAPGRARGNRRP